MNSMAICPTCEKPSKLDKSNPFRPFCSERCKLIDLGQWAEESYKIPESDSFNTINDDNNDPVIKH